MPMSRYPTAGVVVTHYNPPQKRVRKVPSMTFATLAKFPRDEFESHMKLLATTFAIRKK